MCVYVYISCFGNYLRDYRRGSRNFACKKTSCPDRVVTSVNPTHYEMSEMSDTVDHVTVEISDNSKTFATRACHNLLGRETDLHCNKTRKTVCCWVSEENCQIQSERVESQLFFTSAQLRNWIQGEGLALLVSYGRLIVVSKRGCQCQGKFYMSD